MKGALWGTTCALLLTVALTAGCSGEVTPLDAVSGPRDGAPGQPDGSGGCAASTCAQGCCAAGQCEPWSEGSCGATGQAGEPCVQCSGSCQQGRCVTSSGACGPHNCGDGCCEGDVCLGGVQLSACGSGGAPCEMCTPPKACRQQRCQ